MTDIRPATLPEPFSFKAMMFEIAGRRPSPTVDFEPPVIAPITKPLGESTVGVLVSCGVHTDADAPFAATNDLTYRMISRETAVADLRLGHQAAIRYYALQDLNCAYPRDRPVDVQAAAVDRDPAQRQPVDVHHPGRRRCPSPRGRLDWQRCRSALASGPDADPARPHGRDSGAGIAVPRIASSGVLRSMRIRLRGARPP